MGRCGSIGSIATAAAPIPTEPRLRVVNLQVLVALALIIAGAYVFVDAVGSIASSMGVDEALLALVIAPIATELPEKFNSIIWIRQRKDTLAMGNITGAMVFQSAIPTVIALLFAGAAWSVASDTALAFASAGMAFLSVFLIFGVGRSVELHGRRLLVGGAVYVLYLGLVADPAVGRPGLTPLRPGRGARSAAPGQPAIVIARSGRRRNGGR